MARKPMFPNGKINVSTTLCTVKLNLIEKWINIQFIVRHEVTLFREMWITFHQVPNIFLTSALEIIIFISRQLRTAHKACG